MQPDVRLSVLATCLAMAACGGDTENAQTLGSAGGTTGAGGAGGATAGAGGAAGAAAGAGGVAGTTSGAGGASGTTGVGGTAGAGGAAADAGKEAGGRCNNNADCQAPETCIGAVGSCPVGMYCILAPRPGTCGIVDAGTDAATTPVACANTAECQPNQVCVQTMFPIYAPRPDAAAPSDASSGDVYVPKLGECRPATQAAADVWWGAVESALRGS